METLDLIEAAIAAVFVFQAARILFKPAVRLEVIDAGLPVALVVGMALAAVAAIGWAVWQWPLVRHVAAAIALVAMVALWWRGRPDYGRSKGMPPGSLGIGHSLDFLTDKRLYLREAERWGPVFKMSQFGRPTVCIIGHERARAMLANNPGSLAGAALPYTRLIPRGALRYMPSEDHKAVAPLLRSAFSQVALDEATPAVRESYRRALSRLAADSSAVAGGVRARPYFQQPVFEALGRLFLGLDDDDPRLAAVGHALPSLAFERMGGSAWRRQLANALAEITSVLKEIQADWSDAPDDANLSALRALVESTPNALDDPTLTGNFILIFRIATMDLLGLHDWIFKFVSDHLDVLDAVRSPSPADTAGQSAADPATRVVLETLRLEQAEYLYRTTTAPIQFEGYQIPAGWLMRLCVQESHRDPSVFADPEQFNPDRFATRTYTRKEYSPFGADAHGCMGFHMGHFLGRLFVEELARGYEWQVTRDGPPERRPRHRHHWQPSERFRVAMTARA